eukprot:maker-scaffold72_size415059-snap-gene-0.11 protein:Tk08662 transcript:maker-scaffold72_size415059-snap-gene-0.11-mRNA-1 annotation:"hypothetical protein"
MQAFYILVLLPALVLAEADSGYGYGPKIYCRDTNTSIYAEVCVPGFTNEVQPVELDVKKAADDEYCFTQTKTECEETTKNVEREICSYNYVQKKETLSATTTQVTYEKKSETMKVTSCKPAGYGSNHYGSGDHQYCSEEYQTQEYSVPKVDTPVEVPVETAIPEPIKECVLKTLTITEVVCKDVETQKCISLTKLEEAKESVDTSQVILGEPNCKQITLTLPTEACSEQHGYGH